MKHFALDYHSMGDKVTRGSLCLPHVYTINQLVDNIITKTLSKHQFFLLGFKIGVFIVEASSSIDELRKKDPRNDNQGNSCH